jgi:GAF domain-containing protein
MPSSSLNDEVSLDQSLLALARILFAGRTAEETLRSVVQLAKDTIGGCDSASVTMVENGRPRTTVSTSALADEIDQHQYGNDEGPCLDAVRLHKTVVVNSMEHDSRWPHFTPAAFALGARSSLSLPLLALDDPVGALNMYSLTEASFTDAEQVGAVFAGQAAITLANASAFHHANDLARNLTIALERRDVIGQAKGIIMAERDIAAEEAFELLRRVSQNANKKLHDIALEVVDRRSFPKSLGD